MSQHPSFIIDAFTNQRFSGNPAAVCLINQVLKDEEYQKIAAEFNLSETAFPVPIGSSDFKNCSQFSLRWFTPKTEVSLCGHATLATSHVLFNEIGNINQEIKFDTHSGVLIVKRGDDSSVEMSFPKFDIVSIKFSHMPNPLHGIFSEFAAPSFLSDVIKCVVPSEISIECVAYSPKSKKLVVVVDELTTKFELEAIKINTSKMLELHDGTFVRGIAVTLKPRNPLLQGFFNTIDEEYDYACRYFAPWVGINEDPATGSAQCVLGPFWQKITDKNQFYVLQVSLFFQLIETKKKTSPKFPAFPTRGAQFCVKIDEDRVVLNGQSVTVLCNYNFFTI